MNKQEYVEMFQKVAEQVWDIVMAKNDNVAPVVIHYTEKYNGGPHNEKMKYAKLGDSGFDLRAESNGKNGYTIAPGGTIVIGTGIKVAIPKGLELQVRTRSGSPIKVGFNVANSPGTVDSGYRGVVGVLCHNISDKMIHIKEGDRIAQGVLCPVYKADFDEVDEDEFDMFTTERGSGAYNSTGTD